MMKLNDCERLPMCNGQSNTARDDYEWPYYGTVDRLLVELMGTAWDTREAAIVHFCTRGRRAG